MKQHQKIYKTLRRKGVSKDDSRRAAMWVGDEKLPF